MQFPRSGLGGVTPVWRGVAISDPLQIVYPLLRQLRPNQLSDLIGDDEAGIVDVAHELLHHRLHDGTAQVLGDETLQVRDVEYLDVVNDGWCPAR
jgi:hypothetical protein